MESTDSTGRKYSISVNRLIIPAMISIRGNNEFLDQLYMDFMDVPSVLSCISFPLGPVDHFNIYVDPLANLNRTLRSVLLIIDDAYKVEDLLQDLDLDGKNTTKQQKTG